MKSHYVVRAGEDYFCSQAVDEILARRGFLQFALRPKTTAPAPAPHTHTHTAMTMTSACRKTSHARRSVIEAGLPPAQRGAGKFFKAQAPATVAPSNLCVTRF